MAAASEDARFDVAGIGNAIVDVLARVTDATLKGLSLAKGSMTLIDAKAADTLYRQMGPAIECSGGSAANTIAGIASLGGSAAFIGKVKRDALGEVFRHDIVSLGVHFPTAPAHDGAATARCLVFVTPDAQRTLQTYLGASVELGPEDIDADVIARAALTYLEGYLYDPPRAQAAFRKASAIAHAKGRKVALSLSDPFCVGRHRSAFRALVEGEVDVLFANEHEIMALYESANFDQAVQAVRGQCEIACLTRSERGSIVLSKDELHVIDAAPVAKVIDTTGAGDLYAAGFLYGHARGLGLGASARLASLCAAEVISHIGARPETPLAELARAAGLT